jgi:glycosyltransferase involved in cell wall biosynthesis
VYDCIDEWAGLLSSSVLRQYVAKLDENLCRTCDFLFVGSQTLHSARVNLNPNILLVPQGVDFSLFKKASEADTEIPDDMRPIPHPIVGLTGVLNRDRLDVELLCYLADHQPEVSIVLIGPVWKGLRTEELQRRSNIHLLGNKQIEDLPRYLRTFDVSIIPYVLNDFTKNIYPLKLHEYMASGKPIVSTRIPAVAEFAGLVRIADDQEEFRQHIMAALAEHKENLVKKRIAVAAANDWEGRVEKKSQAVKTLLSTPHGMHADSLAGDTPVL